MTYLFLSGYADARPPLDDRRYRQFRIWPPWVTRRQRHHHLKPPTRMSGAGGCAFEQSRMPAGPEGIG